MRLDSMMQNLAMQAQQSPATVCQDDSKDGLTPAQHYFEHSSAQRSNTDAYMMKIIRKEYPDMGITNFPCPLGVTDSSLLRFADATGKAKYKPLLDNDPENITYTQKMYAAPAGRLNGPSTGAVFDSVRFGRFSYTYNDVEYLLFICDGRDTNGYPTHLVSQILLHTPGPAAQTKADDLIRAVGTWSNTLHDEIWVFSQGYWQKDAALFASVMKSEWRDVILDEDDKIAIQNDVRRFFDSRERYDKLRVPWKRGVIYYGPPGNGKTVSIKATMHELYKRAKPVHALYVRSLAGYGGPELSIKLIFAKARAEAPCLLIFEDLDSMITDQVRSYFLNEVDGLTTNEGVMMIGSTNHLERLDPGISKRPSRFDRKFLFPKPNMEQRTKYCEYWRGKLKDNEEIEFPEELSSEIAKITSEFSFAYIQEAFVASLLAIAFRDEEGRKSKDLENMRDRFENLILWQEIKKQVKILRDEM